MSSVENDPQFQLLFKQFNNTVNTRQDVAFSDGNNKAPFRNYVFNNEVFSNNIPADLSNISFGSGSSTVYGLAALDASFNAAGVSKGTSYKIPGTDLTFFFRQELEFTNPTTNRTYWIDACNNNSALADTIPFNYDKSQFNSYETLLFDNTGVVKVPIFKSGAPGLKWLMDYKSGFVQFYGTDSNVNAWAGTSASPNNAPPRLSYIKYTGPKGAAGGGGGGGGGDSSFNKIDISGINLMNIERFRFISNNSGNTLIPTTGSSTGYYKIASVDSMRHIKTSNLAETVTTGKISFFTRVNFEDSGAGNSNKLQWNGTFDIGVNQTYLLGNYDYPESFINTNHCLVQVRTPFESLHIVQNSATSKYELYLKFNQYTELNKYIDLTVVLEPNNENKNPISSKFDDSASNNINWELDTITTPIATLPSSDPGSVPSSTTLTKFLERSWTGTMLPFSSDRSISTYGNNILQTYTFENYNGGGTNDHIATIEEVSVAANDPKMLAASGVLKLFVRQQPGGPGTLPINTQEIVAIIGIQATGSNGTTLNEQSFLNVLSNTTTVGGTHLINNINIKRTSSNSSAYGYAITIDTNTAVPPYDLYAELTNNNLNPEEYNTFGEKRYWTLNKYGLGGSGTLVKRVDTRSPLDSFSAFNNDYFLVNKLGMGGGNSSGFGFLTEDDSVVDNAIQTNIGADGNNMIINKLEDGAVVIDAKTSASTAGGLKIFNSGTSAIPQLSLIPFTGPSTLGNPTFINANSSGSTQFQGSGNMTILNGIQNLGSFDIYQGNGTTAAGSNILNSEHIGGSSYRVSLNNSRNDTDIVINTPLYNIIDPLGGGGAMEVNSGTNTVTFNAPVIFNNSVAGVALVQELKFNTSNIPPNNWFTLATSGDGLDKGGLRSDALFVLEDRLGSHHHCLIFRAGAKYDSGIYIDVQSSWYNVPRIQALRIGYHSTWDGSILQAQLNSDSASQSTSTMTLRIYQNKNDEGWFTNSTLLPPAPFPNNSPRVYVTDSPSNPGAVYPNFRESGNIIYDGNGRNTTQTTTSNFIIKDSELQVDDGHNVNLTVNNENILLRNTGSNSGNIVLDTVGTINPNTGSRGIAFASHEGILLQTNNNSNSSNPGIFVVQGQTFFWNQSGFNMNGKNVVGAQQMESNIYTRNSSSTILIGEPQTTTSGRYINIREPLLVYRTSSSNGINYLNNLGGGSFPDAANGIQFHDSTNDYQVIRRNRENWAMTSPYQKTYICALSLRNAGSTTVKRLQAQGGLPPGTVGTDITGGHAGGEGYDMWSVSSSTQGGNPYIGTKIYCPNDVYIRRILMQDYGHRTQINNSTGSTQNVSFEIWLAHGLSSNASHSTSYSWYSATQWPTTDVCPTNIRDSNNTSNAIRIAAYTRTISTGTSVSNSYPFNGGSGINVQRNYDIVSLNGGSPYKIPAGHTYGIFLIERRVNTINSGSLIFTNYLSNIGSNGFASQPIKFEIYGEINYLS